MKLWVTESQSPFLFLIYIALYLVHWIVLRGFSICQQIPTRVQILSCFQPGLSNSPINKQLILKCPAVHLPRRMVRTFFLDLFHSYEYPILSEMSESGRWSFLRWDKEIWTLFLTTMRLGQIPNKDNCCWLFFPPGVILLILRSLCVNRGL